MIGLASLFTELLRHRYAFLISVLALAIASSNDWTSALMNRWVDGERLLLLFLGCLLLSGLTYLVLKPVELILAYWPARREQAALLGVGCLTFALSGVVPTLLGNHHVTPAILWHVAALLWGLEWLGRAADPQSYPGETGERK